MTIPADLHSARRLMASLAMGALLAAGCGSSGSEQDAAATSAATVSTTTEASPGGDTTTMSTIDAGDTTADTTDRDPVDPTTSRPPGAFWAVEQTSFDLVEVSTATGEVLQRVRGWGADAADPSREGGAQRLVDVEAVGDSIWVSDCCEPAVGSVYLVDPTGGAPVPESSVRIDGTFPAGSPDGSLLAVQILDLGVAVVDSSDGSPVVEATAIGDIVPAPSGASLPVFARPLSWLDDQTLVISTSVGDSSTISFVSITNPAAPSAVGAQIEASGTVIDGATRGDGAAVVALSEEAGGDVVGHVFDPETGEELAVFDLPTGTQAIDYDRTGTYLLATGETRTPLRLGLGEEIEVPIDAFGAAWIDSGAAVSSEGEPTLSAIEREDLVATGLEGVGCWFYRGGDENDKVFHGGDDVTLAIVDGEPVVGRTEGFWTPEDVVEADGYRFELIDLGEPEPASIESTIRDATLVVTSTDGVEGEASFEGLLWCGV